MSLYGSGGRQLETKLSVKFWAQCRMISPVQSLIVLIECGEASCPKYLMESKFDITILSGWYVRSATTSRSLKAGLSFQ